MEQLDCIEVSVLLVYRGVASIVNTFLSCMPILFFTSESAIRDTEETLIEVRLAGEGNIKIIPITYGGSGQCTMSATVSF